jgi:small subunit ribosomal protein S9
MKPFVIVGKRKMAVARAYVKEGKGRIRINKFSIDVYQPETIKMKILEPVVLAGEDKIKNVDIEVNVKGGGIMAQAEAIRQAIAKAILKISKSEALRKKFVEYDRSMIAFDPRRNEPSKPSRSRKGPRRKRQTSYR